MLQMNTSGSWKNVVPFEMERREDVLRAVRTFSSVLGRDVRWCFLHDSGAREWLGSGFHIKLGWKPITPEQPKPLDDVLVSVLEPCDGERLVYQAWRNAEGKWMHSGSEDPLLLEPYAWDVVPEPAPMTEVTA